MRVSDFDELLSLVPVDGMAKARLAGKMTEPNRRYHNADHLMLLWRRHQLHGRGTVFSEPGLTTLIACAIAYHDSIYDGHRRDNEEQSAEFWMDASKDSAMSEADRQWVAVTIRATHDHLGYDPGCVASDGHGGQVLRERARLWLLDLDLTPLGETPGDFDQNSPASPRGNPDFTDAQWLTATRGFFQRINDAPLIYRSPVLAAIYEKSRPGSI